MSKTAKHRKKYRPRPVAANPIALAMRRAAKVPADEIAQVLAPVLASFKAMREGVGSENDWCILAGTVELALAVEHIGVVRGLAGHLRAAESALAAIRARAMGPGVWTPTPLYFQEIGALDEFTWLHKAQLEHLSEGEWHAAHARAEALVRSAGGRAVDIRQIQCEQQLQLLANP